MSPEKFDAKDLIGKRVSHFEVISLIDETKKSMLYRAKDISLKRVVALKILRPGSDKEREEQLLLEGPRLAAVGYHPNMTTVFSAGSDGPYKYLAMQIVEGQNLEEMIREGKKFSQQEILKIMKGVASAVDMAHKTGLKYNGIKLEHNDIKLANIKADSLEEDKIFLLDFGGRLTRNESCDDIVGMGKVLKTLVENCDTSNRVNQKKLENIVEKATSHKIETASDFYDSLTKIERSITRRKLLKIAGGSVATSTLIYSAIGGILKHIEYRKSANFVLDEIKKSGELPKINLFKELHLRLCNKKLREVKSLVQKDRFPYDISAKAFEWNTTDGTTWTSGFWPALMFEAYVATNDKEFKEDALARMQNMKAENMQNDTTNSLVRFYYSHCKGYTLLKDEKLKETALQAAKIIAEKFDISGEKLGPPIKVGLEEINGLMIDHLGLLVPFLCWGYREGGGEKLAEIARMYSEAAIRFNVNDDGSVVQCTEVDFQKERKIRNVKISGYNADSCLARAQVRAFAGFKEVARTLGEKKFLDAAKLTADYFLSHLPEDNVSVYDFKDPREKIPRDTASASQVSFESLDLFSITNEQKYRNKAIQILHSLTNNFFVREKNFQGFLRGGWKRPNTDEDSTLVYGDYYYLKSLGKVSN